MPKCIDCKWFQEQTLQDEIGTVFYGICEAIIGEECLMTESDVYENAPCDLYVKHNVSNNTAKKP